VVGATTEGPAVIRGEAVSLVEEFSQSGESEIKESEEDCSLERFCVLVSSAKAGSVLSSFETPSSRSAGLCCGCSIGDPDSGTETVSKWLWSSLVPSGLVIGN